MQQFPDESFDCIIANHVLEHIASCGYDVKECRVSDYLDAAAVAYLHLIKEDRIYMGVKI